MNVDGTRLDVLIPGPLESRTGGYEYDRRIIDSLRGRGWDVHVHRLGADFPFPSEPSRAHAAAVLAALQDGALVLVDGLAFGALPEEAERERHRLRFVALVHHPLARETGIDPVTATRLHADERRALSSARYVIVTSRATVNAVAALDVPGARIAVVEPGTDVAPLARGSQGTEMHLLAVGSVVPRKGYETLIEAVATLADRAWRLTCVGSLDRAPRTSARVLAQSEAAGLSDRVVLAGEMEGAALGALYDSADLFVLPTFYEGYGMVVAEAIARGLPVVSTPTGGIPELVGHDAGLLVPVADATALGSALARFMDDPALRIALKAGARGARSRLVGWDQRGAEMSQLLANI